MSMSIKRISAADGVSPVAISVTALACAALHTLVCLSRPYQSHRFLTVDTQEHHSKQLIRPRHCIDGLCQHRQVFTDVKMHNCACRGIITASLILPSVLLLV